MESNELETRLVEVELRLSNTEKCMEGLEKDTKLMLTNHLPHIQTELSAIQVKLDSFGMLFKWQFGILSGVILAIIGVAIGLIFGT